MAISQPQSKLSHDWKMLLFGAALAISPDLDFLLVWVLHLSRAWHRSVTHSILFALAVWGLLLAVTGIRAIGTSLAYGAAFMSHGVLDFLTTKRGGGVELLWPFSSERFKLGLIGFSEFPVAFNPAEVVRSSLIELVVFVPILIAVLLLREELFSSHRSA